jgi:hypothetical protein
MLAAFSYVCLQGQNCAVGEDIEKLKQRLSLLDYLRQQNWTARPAAHGPDFVELCPLHPETRPSMSTPAKISFTVTVAARAAISFALSSCPLICPSAKASLTSGSKVLFQPTLLRCSNKSPVS